MKFDITLAVHPPGTRSSHRDTVVVEAENGDAAAAAGQIAGEAKIGGDWFHIVGVAPSGQTDADAPVAAVEGEDASFDDAESGIVTFEQLPDGSVRKIASRPIDAAQYPQPDDVHADHPSPPAEDRTR